MRAYFDSEKMLGNHTCYAMGLYNSSNITAEETEQIKTDVYGIMSQYKAAVVKAEGNYLYDSEIFYHESCIYLDVLKRLLDEGFFVWECYDAWYARREGWTQDMFEKYVTEIVEEIANQYIEKNLHYRGTTLQ